MGTEYVVVSEPETITIISGGEQGPVGIQGPIGLPGDVTTGLNISVDGELSLFSGTTGKLLKRATQTGLLKATNGVLSSATPSVDYIVPADLSPYAPLNNPNFTGNFNWDPQTNEQFHINTTPHPRTITMGVLRIDHMSGINGTTPIYLNINSNGFNSTYGLRVNYLASNSVQDNESHVYDLSVDTDSSTGGQINAMSVSKVGSGIVEVTAVEANAGCNLLRHNKAVLAYATKAFTNTIDITSNVMTPSTNSTLFASTNDYLYLGYTEQFNNISVILATLANDGGIIPTFEYSTGTNAWTLFSPIDGTNGMRTSGNISWTLPLATAWTTHSVNSSAQLFYIRIRRTNGALLTIVPIESTIQISISIKYGWDKNAHLDISTINILNIPSYASVAAAIAGGLLPGDVFKDTSPSHMLCVV